MIQPYLSLKLLSRKSGLGLAVQALTVRDNLFILFSVATVRFLAKCLFYRPVVAPGDCEIILSQAKIIRVLALLQEVGERLMSKLNSIIYNIQNFPARVL